MNRLEEELWRNRARGEYQQKLANAQKRRVRDTDLKIPEHDTKAEDEAKAIASETGYDKIEEANDHKRKEKFKDNFLLAGLIIFWCVIFVIILFGILWVYHHATPISYHFLSSTQLSELKAMLFGSGISAFAAHFANRYMK